MNRFFNLGIAGVLLVILTCGLLWMHQTRYKESFKLAWVEFSNESDLEPVKCKLS